MTRESFPRQAARTNNFRLGAPRQVAVSPDGQRIIFVRSLSGTDSVNRLWVIDVADNQLTERCVADPLELLAGDDEQLPDAERARRERMRESTGGITTYSTDRDMNVAAFALSGRLFVADLTGVQPPRELPVITPVIDPRLSPDGQWVSYVSERSVRVIRVHDGADSLLAAPDTDTVTWGLADFIAAEELDRHRGLWWSPASECVLVERFDDEPVATWWISDPANPSREPHAHRYPAAGTANADVTLHVISIDGAITDIEWDRTAYPYVTTVSWTEDQPPLITVMSRDQKESLSLIVDVESGATRSVHADSSDTWLDVMPGLPRLLPNGRLLHAIDDHDTDTRRLAINGKAITAAGHNVMALLDVDDDSLLVSIAVDPSERIPWLVSFSGEAGPLVSSGTASASRGGDITVVTSAQLSTVTPRWEIRRGSSVIGEIESRAEKPDIAVRVTLLRSGERAVPTAVIFPTDHVMGSQRLPIVMAPYGGPHHSEVLSNGLAFARDQWIADQGFVVIVADGRGTPGLGLAWERAVYRDFVTPVLDDQVEALRAVVDAFPHDCDPTRVGITGWSFGGWLAGLAVLERPDVFHAAVSGAPVTDWRLYDTAYTERYLGTPDDDPEAYERQSLVARAANLTRPLLLIHGLVDDNVVVANTLALSGALLAAGRPHSVLPLTGITHMASAEEVAENLLRLEVDFLRASLATTSN